MNWYSTVITRVVWEPEKQEELGGKATGPETFNFQLWGNWCQRQGFPAQNSLTSNHSRSSGRSSISIRTQQSFSPLPQGFCFSQRDRGMISSCFEFRRTGGQWKTHQRDSRWRPKQPSRCSWLQLYRHPATAGQTRGGGEKECAREHNTQASRKPH